jgi:tetratricopeptide (TPR) repeat protein
LIAFLNGDELPELAVELPKSLDQTLSRNAPVWNWTWLVIGLVEASIAATFPRSLIGALPPTWIPGLLAACVGVTGLATAGLVWLGYKDRLAEMWLRRVKRLDRYLPASSGERGLREPSTAASAPNELAETSSLRNRPQRRGRSTNDAEALVTIRASVKTCRLLAEKDLKRYSPDLAVNLTELSTCLNDSGDRAGALAAIEEALGIYRRLAREDPTRFTPDLAMSLNNLAIRLRDTGDRVGAIAATREALRTYRSLARENPKRFSSDLATILDNLSIGLGELGNHIGAVAAIKEASHIYRLSAQENPARFLPLLATTLNNLSIRLCDSGDYAGALAAIHEALAIRERMSHDSPGEHRSIFETSLRILARVEAQERDARPR